MSSHPHLSPIVEFLGQDAGAGGPFALLGLLHQIESQEQIVRACNRRLHQIDRHRHRSTPDAGEVRLAVHAAASQLLDPKLRSQLAKSWPAGIPMSVPKAWKPSLRASRLTPAFIQRARLLIAASGGWNATARKRLAYFARVNRVTALELIGALSPPKDLPPAASHEPVKPTIDRLHFVDPPPRGSPEWFVAYTLLFIVGGAVLTTILVSPIQQVRDSKPSALTPVPSPEQNAQDEPASSPHLMTQEREEFTHYTAIAHELDQLVARSQSDPAKSIERFATIYPQFVDSWLAFPEPALQRSGLQIAEFVRRVSSSPESTQAVLPVFYCDTTTDDPSKPMIRSAVIDVVLSEPGLSNNARAQLETIRKQCSSNDPRPTQDIIAALVTVAGLQAVDSRTDDSQWWSKWIQGVRAITSSDEDQRTRLVLSAMSARLRDQGSISETWDRTVIELVNAVSWRDGTPSRYWLLSQFADESVSTARLAALTSALAIHSGANQIDAQMVLNPSSTFIQRQQLAQAFRLAWSVDSADSSASDVYSELVNELHIRVSITPTQMDQSQGIRAMVELARLNTAAWQFANGHDELATETLGEADEQIGVSKTAHPVVLAATARDTQWAEDAINAQGASELGVLFAHLVQDDGPGVNSAYALVHLATLHANSEIRSLASTQIVRYKQHPSVLIAIDRAIGGSRISSRLEQLVLKVVAQPLPARTDDSWYQQTHRALLSLLTSALAQSIETELSALEEELGNTYSARLSNQESSILSTANALSNARQRYRQLLFELRSQSEQSFEELQRLSTIEVTLAVRIVRAKSSMHQFLAYQQAVCELHSVRVELAVPGSSFPVGDVMAQLDTRLDQSKTLLDQMIQTERCIAQLWVIWFEGGAP